MSVFIKNAIAIAYPVTQPVDGSNNAQNPTPGEPVSVQVYFEEATPSEVLIEYGLTLRQPAFMQCELADAGSFGSQTIVQIQLYGVTYGDGEYYQAYVCQGNPENHRVFGFSAADHSDIVMELQQYAELGE